MFGSFVGDGPVDVQTQSSAIDLSGVSGALTTFSESGHTSITGVPSVSWDVSSGSDVDFVSAVKATLQASTGSGTVYTPERLVTGSIEKRRVAGELRRHPSDPRRVDAVSSADLGVSTKCGEVSFC